MCHKTFHWTLQLSNVSCCLQAIGRPKVLRFDASVGPHGAFFVTNADELAAELDQLTDTLSVAESDLTADLWDNEDKQMIQGK